MCYCFLSPAQVANGDTENYRPWRNRHAELAACQNPGVRQEDSDYVHRGSERAASPGLGQDGQRNRGNQLPGRRDLGKSGLPVPNPSGDPVWDE